MVNHLDGKTKPLHSSIANPETVSGTDRTKDLPPPQAPYTPYFKDPALSEPPYKPYANEPVPESPYEPYKDM